MGAEVLEVSGETTAVGLDWGGMAGDSEKLCIGELFGGNI